MNQYYSIKFCYLILASFLFAANVSANQWETSPGDPAFKKRISEIATPYDYISNTQYEAYKQRQCDLSAWILESWGEPVTDPWIAYMRGLVGFTSSGYQANCKQVIDQEKAERLRLPDIREQNLHAAVTLQPRFISAWTALVHHYLSQTDIKQAKIALDKALLHADGVTSNDLIIAEAAYRFSTGEYKLARELLVRQIFSLTSSHKHELKNFSLRRIDSFSSQMMGECRSTIDTWERYTPSQYMKLSMILVRHEYLRLIQLLG